MSHQYPSICPSITLVDCDFTIQHIVRMVTPPLSILLQLSWGMMSPLLAAVFTSKFVGKTPPSFKMWVLLNTVLIAESKQFELVGKSHLHSNIRSLQTFGYGKLSGVKLQSSHFVGFQNIFGG